MDTIIFECPPDALQIDEDLCPDDDETQIYAHLRHYCSKFLPLPAVTVNAKQVPPLIIRGHKYQKIALELGLHSIRAIVEGPIEDAGFRGFLSRGDVRILSQKAINDEIAATLILDVWHVFMFDRPLSATAKNEFEERIAGFFLNVSSELLRDSPRGISQLAFCFDDTCAEFKAVTPVGDESWYFDYYVACKEFSDNVARIASYQGRRFS